VRPGRTHRTSAEVKSLTVHRTGEIDRKMADLAGMRAILVRLAENCHGDHRPERPIIDNLAKGSPRCRKLRRSKHSSHVTEDGEVLQRSSKGQSLWTAIALGWLALGSAAAQDAQRHAPGHTQGGDPAVEAFLAASERMHLGMAIEFTGNPDVDFARGMIPHHQGAIDMARAVLEYGRDPEIQELAEAIIAAQEKEIAFLRSWLKRRAEKAG
jgi:hypothetical protein